MKNSLAIGRTKQLALGFALLAALYGCASDRLHREGNDLLERGQIEEGLAKLEEAVMADPKDFKLRTDLINARSKIIGRLLTTAASEGAASRLDEAEGIYQRVLKIDPGNERAQSGIDAIARDRRHASVIEEAQEAFKKGDSEKALELLKPVIVENPSNAEMLSLKRAIEEKQAKELMAQPTLKALYTKPVTLEFREANLKMVFEVLSRTTGINFILDKDIKPDLKTTIFVKQTPLEDAVDLLLVTNQLGKKVLNQNSVLVYPNTPAKVKEYQDLVVKGFYLANADVKQTVNLLKTVLKTKDIFIDERLNLLVMRDTPDAVRLAEKLVNLQDLGEPEVMMEVEVLEVQRNKLQELGIRFPDSVALTALPSDTVLTLRELLNLTSATTGVTPPPQATLNLLNQKDIINLLANPRIRVRNREKAKIMIGEKVPVITTTATATGFVSDSVQYLDVGLKLELEPTIHLRDDVVIKVGLEVSNITLIVRSANGTLTYQIGTRNANTVLRLKDGETVVLGGLISDEERKTINSLPGIGDLPIAGRLFSNVRDDKKKTEIFFMITPRLIRNLNRPDAFAEEFWSGNEAVLKTTPLTLQTLRPTATSETQAPTQVAAAKPTAQPPAVDTQQAAEGGGAINLTWLGPQQARLGEQFSIELRVKSDSALRSLPFQVGFDPTVLQIVDVAEGGFFKQGEGKTNFTSNVDQVGGKIFVGIARAGVEGAKGEDSVVNITFKVVSVKPQGEIKLLAATPVGTGGRLPTLSLPEPYVISINATYSY